MTIDLRNVESGSVVILGAKTAKGKNRIREHGNRWLVRERDRSVLGRNLGLLVCPASYVGTPHLNPQYDRPRSIFQEDGYCRWVSMTNDPHFEIAGIGTRSGTSVAPENEGPKNTGSKPEVDQ